MSFPRSDIPPTSSLDCSDRSTLVNHAEGAHRDTKRAPDVTASLRDLLESILDRVISHWMRMSGKKGGRGWLVSYFLSESVALLESRSSCPGVLSSRRWSVRRSGLVQRGSLCPTVSVRWALLSVFPSESYR